MILHDLLKQLVFAGVALALSAYLWSTFTKQYTDAVAKSIKNQSPLEFKQVEFKPAMTFDSKSLIWQPQPINMNNFQSRPSTSRSSSLQKHR
jgi:hypothetical protein